TSILGDRFLAVRFFEDGLKAIESANLKPESVNKILEAHRCAAGKFAIDFDMVLPNDRYDRIITVCNKVLTKSSVAYVSKTEKIDSILTHKWLGLPIFGLIMLGVFFLAFGPIGTTITNWFVMGIDWVISKIGAGVDSLGMASWVSSLITNGVFGGLAAVVGFLPQLMILFFFLAILEDSGYMARAAFIMDRVLRKFGLSGKAFIPMLIGFGCSVPAMTATRTLDRDEDRKVTTMIIPFISCGAKAPIYGVFAGALFFRYSYLIVFSMYLLGIIVAILSAILFKKTILKSASANYIMELPEYRSPTAKNTFLHTWERSKGFLIKAGTVLLGAFIIIWFFSYFGFVDGTFRLLADEEIEHSILGAIGKFLLPIFQPIGFDSWKSTVAILTGFIAKESVVGTLGILYGVTGNVVDNGTLLFEPIRAAFTPAQAYAFMTFALLATPCIAALSAMRKELNSWKWFTFAVAYEMIVAYLVSLVIYQLARLELGTFLSILFAIMVLAIVFFTIRRFIVRKGVVCGSCTSCGLKDECALPKKTEFDALLETKQKDDVK
ncbi:MAG: ferrous iron transport protein B, partial [Bacilli bacterium]|nr:ferrous iron transport protein B [Bacilli bacterium]